MKVITFSRQFPAKHPKAGQPTFFVEKIMAGLAETIPGWKMIQGFTLYDWHEYYNATPKYHTIRAGERWKVGDWFSPRIWSGKPYASKQIEFATPIQIKKIFKFYMGSSGYIVVDGNVLHPIQIEELIKNDGLKWADFFAWFDLHPKKYREFKGQILCWNESIEYLKNFANSASVKNAQ